MCYQFTTLDTAPLLDHLCEAVDAARAKAAGNTPWLNAIEKAWGYLLQQDAIAYDLAHAAIRVPSATEAGKIYIANGDCQCAAFVKGRGVCWHRAAARLVRRALDLAAAPALAPDVAEVSALAAELYAEACAAGDAFYTLDIARAGARSRLGGLADFARGWDQAAAAMQAAALGARIGAAQAVAQARAA
jgi:hypothetical protein